MFDDASLCQSSWSNKATLGIFGVALLNNCPPEDMDVFWQSLMNFWRNLPKLRWLKWRWIIWFSRNRFIFRPAIACLTFARMDCIPIWHMLLQRVARCWYGVPPCSVMSQRDAPCCLENYGEGLGCILNLQMIFCFISVLDFRKIP